MPELALPIAADHPALAGHFPGRPIVPGVVLLDSARHLLESTLARHISGIAQAKFHSPALPGDALQLSYEAVPGALRFEIACAQRRIASGRFTLASST